MARNKSSKVNFRIHNTVQWVNLHSSSGINISRSFNPDGGTETPANIYARRTVQIHPLNSIMYPEVNLGTFIPGHLSDDIVVQYRYWYDIATSSS